jgi:maleylacetate reductase
MTEPFVFPGLMTRVVFEEGTIAQTGEEVHRLGRSRVLVLASPRQRQEMEALRQSLGPLMAGVFTGAAMHTPVEVTDQALAAFRDADADCVVSLGGGSTMGLSKAIAARTGADQVVLPTTYAGSEMTDILGETKGGEKTTRRDPSIRPEVVIYDVDLTLPLPLALTVTSALNAIAHVMEALYASDRNPVIELMARAALPAFRDALPRLAKDPQDPEARADALYAA